MKINKNTKRLGIQYKQVSSDSVSVDNEKRTIVGYGAVFDNVDRDGDKLIKGCFEKSISERGPESNASGKILMLYQHDTADPIGRITKLEETSKGLYFESEIDDVDSGNRVLKQLESGTITQFSIGFSYVSDKCTWKKEKNGNDYYEVKEVVLYEISPVSIAANPETEFLGFKSIEEYDNAYNDFNNEIEYVLKGLNIQRKHEIQKIIAKAVSLSSAVKPIKESLTDEEADKSESEESSMFNFIIKN